MRGKDMNVGGEEGKSGCGGRRRETKGGRVDGGIENEDGTELAGGWE